MKTNAFNTIHPLALPGIILIAGLAGNVHAASQSWIMSGGDPAQVAINVGGTATASASAFAASAQGSAFAEVAMHGSPYVRVATATASASGTRTPLVKIPSKNASIAYAYTLAANGRLEYLGGSIWTCSYSRTATSGTITYSASLPYISKTWKPPTKVYNIGIERIETPFFGVGPFTIPVTVTPSVSVGYSASVEGSVNTDVRLFKGTLAPANIDCSATATCATDFLGATASITGKLNVFTIKPTVNNTCVWNSTGTAGAAGVVAILDYRALDGYLDGTASLSILGLNLSGSKRLMSWNGMSGNLPLFGESVTF